MNQATFVKSAANTDKLYTIIHVRIDGDQLKFQGIGETTNREYGVSDTCPVGCLPEMTKFIQINSVK